MTDTLPPPRPHATARRFDVILVQTYGRARFLGGGSRQRERYTLGLVGSVRRRDGLVSSWHPRGRGKAEALPTEHTRWIVPATSIAAHVADELPGSPTFPTLDDARAWLGTFRLPAS